MKTLKQTVLSVALVLIAACGGSRSKPQYGDHSGPTSDRVRIRLTVEPDAYGSVLFWHPSGSIVQRVSHLDELPDIYDELARGAVTAIGNVRGANASQFESEWFFEHNTASWLRAEVSGWGVQVELER